MACEGALPLLRVARVSRFAQLSNRSARWSSIRASLTMKVGRQTVVMPDAFSDMVIHRLATVQEVESCFYGNKLGYPRLQLTDRQLSRTNDPVLTGYSLSPENKQRFQ